MSDLTIKWQFPEKLGFLFNPHRYKVAYGGRDGSKSWSFARALLILGTEKPLRIGCFREIQKSIKDSVHQLLSDQIEALGLSGVYQVLHNEIRGPDGTLFVFSGLSNLTRDSIKSFEGLDIAWVEEAHSVVKRSWEILIPTIRKPNSEIWVSFNPEMETDYTYDFFITNQPEEAKVVKINFSDNPWRSKVLDKARELMQRDHPDDYRHIYLGECLPAVQGAIYFKEVSALKESGRLCNVPYDPALKVHVVVDLGFNDYMALILVQRLGSEIRIIRYIEDRQRHIPDYSQELRNLNLNYGTVYLPHDGRAETLISASNPHGTTAEAQFQGLGWTTEIVQNVGIEQGIRKAREIFPRILVDRTNAIELLNRLGRYRRRVNAQGQASSPVHDDESHGSDGFRYLSLIADQMTNDTYKPQPVAEYRHQGTNGWMAG